jgi:hypothetical protein
VASARALSNFGTVMAIWALIFRERAEGPIAISAMFIAAALPYILFGPWVGWLADRFSTRHLVPIVAIAQGILTLVFTVDVPFWVVLALIFVYNVIAAIENHKNSEIDALCNDYVKRCSPMHAVKLELFPAARTPDPEGQKAKESETLLKMMKPGDTLILCDERGKTFSSRALHPPRKNPRPVTRKNYHSHWRCLRLHR